MRLLVTTLLGCLLVSLCGCTTAPACSTTFTPCGGDIVGTWAFDTDCNTNMAPMICAGATSTVTPNATGTYTFNANGTFSVHLTVDESGTTTLPAACLANLTSCSALDTSGTLDGVVITETCTGTTSQSCSCAFSEKGVLTQAGTYSLAGSTVSTTQTGGLATAPQGYCVSGSQLQLSTGASGTSSNGYLLFTRQ